MRTVTIHFDLMPFSIFAMAHAVIQTAVVLHVLMNKREESTSAIAWILLVVFVPVFGILFYLFFGVNRLKTLGVKVARASKSLDRAGDHLGALRKHFAERGKHVLRAGGDWEKWAYFNRPFDRLLPETMPLKNNRLELLRNGTNAYPRMIEEMEKAESTIHLQSFIIMGDQVGKLLFNLLTRKAKAGVKVKVLYDAFGSGKTVAAHFFTKYARGVPNFELRPFALGNILAPWRVQLRNHRKLLVVDGKVAFIGGINISEENDLRFCRRSRYIQDLHCRMTGPAVGELQYSFLRDWSYATKTPPSEVFGEECFPTPEADGSSCVRVVASGPGHSFEATERVFHNAAAAAKRQLWIMTPYFVPDNSFIRMLETAVARGVDVRIIMPMNNNHRFVYYATQSLYSTLLGFGVRIFERKGNFAHTKAMLVDGEWAYMGSSNCDIRSFRLNYELDFVVAGGGFVNDLRAEFNRGLEKSAEITADQLRRKVFGRRLMENTCALLAPIL